MEAVEGAGARVSMDGNGRWMDNVFIERLWRSVKHEEVYLWAHVNLRQMLAAQAQWFEEYNHWRSHQALDHKARLEHYRPQEPPA